MQNKPFDKLKFHFQHKEYNCNNFVPWRRWKKLLWMLVIAENYNNWNCEIFVFARVIQARIRFSRYLFEIVQFFLNFSNYLLPNFPLSKRQNKCVVLFEHWSLSILHDEIRFAIKLCFCIHFYAFVLCFMRFFLFSSFI